jgi:hypothetical protein
MSYSHSNKNFPPGSGACPKKARLVSPLLFTAPASSGTVRRMETHNTNFLISQQIAGLLSIADDMSGLGSARSVR